MSVDLDPIYSAFQRLSKTCATTEVDREFLRGKLKKTVADMEFDTTNGKLLESQVTLTSAFLSTLDSIDKQAFQLVKTQLASEQATSDKETSRLITSFLAKITGTDLPPNAQTNVAQADSVIESRFAQEEMSILPGELLAVDLKI